MDCKVDRKAGILTIRNLVLEDSLKKQEAFFRSFKKEMDKFSQFNGCVGWRPDKACDKPVQAKLVSRK